LAIRQPVLHGGLRRNLVLKDRRARVDREALVDRQGLADAVNTRMAEIPISQAELGRESEVSVATIRIIQNAEGTRHHGCADVLIPLSKALDWPGDRLVRIFYRLAEGAPFSPAEIDYLNQMIEAQLGSHSAKVDALDPELNIMRARIDRVETRLGMDPMSNSADFITPSVDLTLRGEDLEDREE
jgi:hypothetical protein